MDTDRSAIITVGGKEYRLVLSVKATKEISKRYGGLDSLGDKLLKTENFELALEEIVWLVVMLANQSILAHNLLNPNDKQDLLTEEMVDLLTTPLELAAFKDAIMEAMVLGTARHVESEDDGSKKRAGRVTDDELFTRLIYYGVTQLHRTEPEVWLMPLGYLLDQWECHKQFMGMAKPKQYLDIDDIIPL